MEFTENNQCVQIFLGYLFLDWDGKFSDFIYDFKEMFLNKLSSREFKHIKIKNLLKTSTRWI